MVLNEWGLWLERLLDRRLGADAWNRSSVRLGYKLIFLSLLGGGLFVLAGTTVAWRWYEALERGVPVTLPVARQMIRSLVIGMGAAFLFQSLILATFVRRMVRAIDDLRRGANRVGQGELSHRIERQSGAELGELEVAFNEMAASLEVAAERQRKTAESFARFVPQNFLRVVAPSGLENIQVGTSVKRPLTILFCDIRGYTSLSERIPAEEMFDFLNAYLARMGGAISGAGGFIDKYIGDAIMALFEDGPDSALRAAAAMREALAGFNTELAEKGWQPIDIGIGIHTGEVVMGTVGFVSRIDSTVIGDAVNVASRVEGLTKQYGASILVTQATKDALSEAWPLEVVDATVTLRGKREPIALWRVAPR